MEAEIRKATMDDLEDIQGLNQQLCTKENEEFDSTIDPNFAVKEGEEYFIDSIEEDFTVVAIVDNKTVGYLVGAISDVEDYRNINKIAEVENMFVLEEHRNSGVGKKLFRAFTEWTRSRNIKRIKVVASVKNKKAIDFYRREGFEDYDLVLEKEI